MPTTRKKKIFKPTAAAASETDVNKKDDSGDTSMEGDADLSIDANEADEKKEAKEEQLTNEEQDTSVTINLELKDSKSEVEPEVNKDQAVTGKEKDEEKTNTDSTPIEEDNEDTDVKPEDETVEQQVDDVKDAQEEMAADDHPDDGNEDTAVKPEDETIETAEPTVDDVKDMEEKMPVDDHPDDGKKDDDKGVDDDDIVVIEDDDEQKDAEVKKEKDAEISGVSEDAAAEDAEEILSYPDSFTKMNQLIVNIGPIKQQDLMSHDLHNILNMTWNFEIKFERKIKEIDGGGTKSERPGFVRIQFSVNSPKFLVSVAKKLGNLRIDGRDMSVKFPEAFNNAVKDCEEYLKKLTEIVAKRKMKKVELMKRQILVRNVPDKVEEDTIKSMFPEAEGVTMNMITSGDGSKKVGSVLLDFESEKACLEFLQSNRDVQIGDCKVKLARNYDDQRNTHGATRGGRNPLGRGMFRGRGRGVRPGGGAVGQKTGGQFSLAEKGFVGKASIRSRGRGSGRGILGARPGVMSPPSVKGNPGNVRRNSSGRGRGSQNPMAQNKMQSPQSQRTSSGPRAKPYPERDSMVSSQQQRQANRAFTMRGQDTSPRGRMQKQRGGRRMKGGRFDQPSSSRGMASGGGDEDPVAMMAYLKSTLARMEEKISQRSDDDYGYGGEYGARKRKASLGDAGYHGHKRQYGEERYAERDVGYEDIHYSNRAYDQYSDRSGARSYNDSSSYYDNRDDYYGDSRYTSPRQGHGSYGHRASSSYSGSTW